MAVDISRVRFDPLLDYAGAELKQGGVLLDADVNELVAIIARRLRALASDTLGRATVSSTTPDAFKITDNGAGGLLIGKGRLYVDGVLAENHGMESPDPSKRVFEFDSLLAENRYRDPIPYASQPYLRSPPELPTDGRHLVYLDVWDREVTHLEQPNLVESAVAVETSSRIQTVWQVRVLADGAGRDTACTTPDASIPGWGTVIAPSTGRLTTGTFDGPATDDPCDLPPTGGYRGVENQTYRVEIHDQGQADGTATFKWSRENASIGSRVATIVSATELELDSLGRDDILRFNSGDWVEIVDDDREFSQRCGEMRKITVNEVVRRITFTPGLPAEMLPGAFPSSDFPRDSNLRVLRWDQKHKVLQVGGDGTISVFQDLDASPAGVIKMPAVGTTLILENGVTVSFESDSAGAWGFKAGDHWIFAARTADASVERLRRAPPRGIHHHFARLGIWDVDARTVSDCRHPWPPQTGGDDCMCTACVTPESHASGQLTIQGAVDKIRDTGGSLCLHAGQYVLREPVRLAAARSLRIHGQGSATMIVAPGAAFVVERSLAIAIEDLAVVSLGRAASAISVRTAFGLTLRRLIVAVYGGIDAMNIQENGDTDAQGAAIALSGVVIAASIDNNLIIAPDGVRALEPQSEDARDMLMTAVLRIDDNLFWCHDSAVKLSGQVAHAYETSMTGNQVLGTQEVGLSAEGLALPGASIRISDNNLNVHGPGIRCAVGGAWIEGNKIGAAREGDRVTGGSGIDLATGLDKSGGGQAQVLSNQISGFPDAGIVINTPLRELIVKLNIIEKCGNGIVMSDAARAGSLSIENNHLSDIGLSVTNATGAGAGITAGILITRTDMATVAGNTLRKIGLETAGNAELIAGIACFAVLHPRITGNVVNELGSEGGIRGIVAGITILAPYRAAEVMHNHVQANDKEDIRTAWYALQIDEPTLGGKVISKLAYYTALRVDANRTLVTSDRRIYVNTERQGSSAVILGNLLSARGHAPAVDVTANEVMFNDNRCELRADSTIPAVRLNVLVAIINANRVRGGGEEGSIHVVPEDARVTAIGNITTYRIIAPLTHEMELLNLIAV